MTPPRGLFVTGTDTEAGKTIVAACLTRRLGATYWKPVQTGSAELPGGDSGTVAHLAALPGHRVVAPRHVCAAPLSPDQAARREGLSIALDDFALPATGAPLVVEGAGGLMVPLNDQALMIDLIGRLGLAVILAARTGLGTINHCLLSLEALAARRLPVAGVIFSGPPHPENMAAVDRFGGGVPMLGRVPWMDPPTPQAVAAAAATLSLPDGFDDA
jgi:dethiobiotin synthase